MSKKKSKKNTNTVKQEITDNTEIQEVKENDDTAKKDDTKNEEPVLTEEKQDVEEKTDAVDNDAKDDNEELKKEEEKKADTEQKPILPRKRKIVKNNQLIIVLCITIVTFITAVVWSVFFNRDITGSWYYIHTGEYTESPDTISKDDTDIKPITHTYTQRVCYSFDDDGVCTVTLGSMSVKGPYQIMNSGKDSMISAGVYYQTTPLLYGNYNYTVSGNIFTGRKLTLYIENGDKSEIIMDRGDGDFSLQRFEDEKLDERLYGRWKNPDVNEYFTFKDDGHMILEIDNTIVVDHVYTVMDGVVLAKYETDSEQSFSYNFSFDDQGRFMLNGSIMEKVD